MSILPLPPVEIKVILKDMNPPYQRFSEINTKIDQNFKIIRSYNEFCNIVDDSCLSTVAHKEVMDNLLSIFRNPQIEFHDNAVPHPYFSDVPIENRPFIVDKYNFTLTWESKSTCESQDQVHGTYLVKNQGKTVISLSPNRSYTMIISRRSNFGFNFSNFLYLINPFVHFSS